MARNLLIVESPAKAHTIEKYLGSDYQVVASMGHIRDLPSSKMGVDTDNHFAPQYVIPPKARPNLKKLKDALKSKPKVYLATDLDREGEAISWHIQEALELEKQGIKFQRITFDEISKSALLKALDNPREINQKLVDAQQARRVLDRLVGYTLSPVLWRKLYKGLSAGRVQSVALKLIVDREIEREKFKPEEYWSIAALLETNQKANFKARLVSYKEQKLEPQSIKTAGEAQNIVDQLIKAEYQVKKIEAKVVNRKASAPYTTASFQQDVVNKLGMSAKNGMRAAQHLYEQGLITYMRTDSVDIAKEALEQIRAQIGLEFGAQYLPPKPNYYRNKQKQAQEAHEAIRPVNPQLKSVEIKDQSAKKVYDLIWRRAIGSQMLPAEIEQTSVDIQAGEGIFRATGQRILFPGFLALYPKRLEAIEGKAQTEETESENEVDQLLPKLTEGEKLNCLEVLQDQHFTEPPPRFSEASLIKALEEYEIGRPSTYAPTIDTILARHYVQLEQKRFVPEMIGRKVTELLAEHFPDVVDLQFTAKMEDQLDQVADGKESYVSVLEQFWGPFKAKVDQKTEAIPKVDLTEETDEICPECGAPMLIKMGRFGKFLACSKFPDCKTTKPLQVNAESGLTCPRCNQPLNWRKSKKGSFLGCSGYPKCQFALWKPEQLPEKIKELEKEEVLPFKQQAIEAMERFKSSKSS